jgi:hypothetical protein
MQFEIGEVFGVRFTSSSIALSWPKNSLFMSLPINRAKMNAWKYMTFGIDKEIVIQVVLTARRVAPMATRTTTATHTAMLLFDLVM